MLILIQPSPNTLSVSWNINGTSINETINTDNFTSSVNIDLSDLNYGENILTICVEDTTSFLRIAKIIAEKYNAKLETIPMPTNLSKQYQTYTCADLTKLNKHIDINWKTVKEFIDYQ